MKVYDKVLKIMRAYPSTRSSDKELIWKYWEESGYISFNAIGRDAFMNSVMLESITRSRRKIQAKYEELQAVESVTSNRRAKPKRKASTSTTTRRKKRYISKYGYVGYSRR